MSLLTRLWTRACFWKTESVIGSTVEDWSPSRYERTRHGLHYTWSHAYRPSMKRDEAAIAAREAKMAAASKTLPFPRKGAKSA